MTNMELADFARGLPEARRGYNWIINPGFTVNQRSASTKAQASGVYGYDRWKGGAVADTLDQVIEALPAGSYALRVTSGGTTTETKFSHSGGNYTVNVPAAATWVEVTDATVERADIRPPPVEMFLCRYYFQRVGIAISFRAADAGHVMHNPVSFSTMRANPTATVSVSGSVTNVASSALNVMSANSAYMTISATAAGACTINGREYTLSAEL